MRDSRALVAAGIIVLIGVIIAALAWVAPAGTANAQSSSSLSDEIANLESQVASLEQDIRTLQSDETQEHAIATAPAPAAAAAPAANTSSAAPVVNSSVVPDNGPPRIEQNGETLNGGWTTYLVGHGFGAFEQVLVTSGGTPVATASTDGGGTFSAGVPLPAAPGAYTYTFTGESTGLSTSATIYASRRSEHVLLP